MKILFTGFAKSQCVNRPYYYTNHSKSKLITPSYAFSNACEEMGHEVVRSPVTVGQDLSEYGMVIVQAYPNFSRSRQTSDYCYGALWCLNQRPDSIIFIEHWSWPKDLEKAVELDFDTALHCPSNGIFRKFLLDDISDENKTLLTDEIRVLLVNQYLKGLFGYRFLYCGFSKFDATKIIDTKHEAYFFNPEAFVPSPIDRLYDNGLLTHNPIMSQLVSHSKKKRWIIAGLSTGHVSCTKNIDFTWDVEYYGRDANNKKTNTVPEHMLIDIFRRSWVCYYTSQGNAGSNYYRNRVRQCVDTGCILFVPDDEEGILFGPSFTNMSIEKIEAMTDDELAELAARQKADYYKSNPVDKTHTFNVITQLLKAA
ncbi:hypothetical protein OS347_000726 [Vibrio vulnificus]|nr:hypothetical protein [Vibrio vulnificus]